MRASEHRIGMGKCRSRAGGTMCPSYRATHEERYLRGRAPPRGDAARRRSPDGRATKCAPLDWCLCKGCRSDCPTHTDMAAYKAEFMSHYYETHRRPRQAWSMGRIGEWAPVGSLFAGFVNTFARPQSRSAWPALRRIASCRSSHRAHSARSSRNGAGDPVVLFDDTFNNHFRPQTAAAAHKLLAEAGCAVELPARRICCGRPYYDYGMLDAARVA